MQRLAHAAGELLEAALRLLRSFQLRLGHARLQRNIDRTQIEDSTIQSCADLWQDGKNVAVPPLILEQSDTLKLAAASTTQAQAIETPFACSRGCLRASGEAENCDAKECLLKTACKH